MRRNIKKVTAITTLAVTMLATMGQAIPVHAMEQEEEEGYVYEIPTEDIIEEPTEEVTEDVTEDVTEEVTEDVTEDVTEEVTEDVTEDVTEETPVTVEEEPEEPIDEVEAYLATCNQANVNAIKEKFLEPLYNTYMGRPGDKEGKNYWTKQLISGEKSPRRVVVEFINTKEYKDMKKNDAAFVEDMYRGIFNRKSDKTGYQYWKAYGDCGLSRLELIYHASYCKEFIEKCKSVGLEPGDNGSMTFNERQYAYKRSLDLIYDMYTKCLGRVPSGEEMKNKYRQAQDTSTDQMLYGIVFGEEYTKKLAMKNTAVYVRIDPGEPGYDNPKHFDQYYITTNKEFVKMLYVAILGRDETTVTEQMMAGWVNKLDRNVKKSQYWDGTWSMKSEMNRCDVFYEVVTSAEFQGRIARTTLKPVSYTRPEKHCRDWNYIATYAKYLVLKDYPNAEWDDNVDKDYAYVEGYTIDEYAWEMQKHPGFRTDEEAACDIASLILYRKQGGKVQKYDKTYAGFKIQRRTPDYDGVCVWYYII